MIQSRVKGKQEGIHRFLREISPEKFGPFDLGRDGIDGYDRTMIMGHQCGEVMVLIAHQMSHDRALIGPRSRDGRAMIARRSWFVIFLYQPSDEDRAEVSPRGAHRSPHRPI